MATAPKKATQQKQQQKKWVPPARSTVKLAEDQSGQTTAKVGGFGRQGSGKTATMIMLAIATMKRYCKACNKIAVYDAEGGSDFLLPIFEAEGVKRLVVRSKAFIDLLECARQAEADPTIGALVIDQITAPWNDVMESCRARLGVSRLSFQHFNEVKRNWAAWPDFFVNSRLHIFVAGRLGFEWIQERDEETGEMESVKGGTKMKTEVDFGHEPNLMLEFELRSENPAISGSPMIHRVHVKKDRSWKLNGKFFDFPDMPAYEKGYADTVLQKFLPHYNALRIGGQQKAFDPSRNSQQLFDPQGKGEYTRQQERKKIALEDLTNTIQLLWPGQDAASKAIRLRLIDALFHVRGWSAVEANKTVDECEAAMRTMRIFEKRVKETRTDLALEKHVLSALQEAGRIELENRKDDPEGAGLGVGPEEENLFQNENMDSEPAEK